ncbi:MAG: ABC transporter permease [Alphaproteobacteria bacterium]|nr:ABC transporter permease [Alphaproteobacteria bacterium]
MDFITFWLASMPLFSVPLVVAALGLILNERAGVLNLGCEGIMLCSALAAAAAYIEFGNSTALGLIIAIIAGAVVGFGFGFFVVVLRTNQVVTGITVVFLGSGLTGLIGVPWTNVALGGLQPIRIPGLTDVPIIGRFLFGQDPVVYITILLVAAVWYFLYRTRRGLELRAVGENPQAADADGVNVEGYRLLSATVGGAFIGLAGGYLALGSAKIFVFDMTQGRGWIAVALVIFARWMPWRALAGGLLFGGIEAIIPRIKALGLPIPQYFLEMAPYAVTLFVLIYAALRLRAGQDAPKALGMPYVRQDRR